MNHTLSLREGYFPGLIADTLTLHIAYYCDKWGFSLPFEAKVARELTYFFERYEEGRDLFLSLTTSEGETLATIAIDGSDAEEKGAHLRWFIVGDAVRGKGYGGELISQALSFCREEGYPGVYLTTFKGLDPARHLYEKHGFALREERAVDQWKGGVVEQLFFLNL
ncbi:MAG: GNAT family N-acetyltransferase [Deltaproteobacteria bacterium]|nr:MAG: GNAT family N-acetyltransferase [Deltaproteobacteria bacterium]